MESGKQGQVQADLIYDVRLHRGEDTEFYLQKGFRVVAFEADPELINYCAETFDDFIKEGKLKIIGGAIVDLDTIRPDDKGRVSFYKNNDVSVWGTVRSEWAERNQTLGTTSRRIDVQAIDFAAALRDHGIPYYMKIDIEGCDIVCLNALQRFTERPDYISIESDKTSLAKIRREIELLSNLGYDGFQAIEQSALHLFQSPPYPSREGRYAAKTFRSGCSGLFGAELGHGWKSRGQILWLYRFIRLGYYLFGDNGILNGWRFRGAWRLRSWATRLVGWFTGGAVPGWYDTHARHSRARVRQTPLKRSVFS